MKTKRVCFLLPTPRLFTGEKSIGIIHKRGNRNIFHFVIEKKIKKKIADSPPVVRAQFCSSVRSKQSSTPLHLCDLRTHLVPSHWNSSAAQTETRDKSTLIVFETNPLICIFIDCVRIRTIYIYRIETNVSSGHTESKLLVLLNLYCGEPMITHGFPLKHSLYKILKRIMFTYNV